MSNTPYQGEYLPVIHKWVERRDRSELQAGFYVLIAKYKTKCYSMNNTNNI